MGTLNLWSEFLGGQPLFANICQAEYKDFPYLKRDPFVALDLLKLPIFCLYS